MIPFDTTLNIEEKSRRFSKIQKIIIWVATIYLWIAGIILIYWIILKIIGHSPDAIDILTFLNSLILAAMLAGGLTIGIQLGKFNRVTKQFGSLSKDFKKHMELEHGKKK